MRTRLLGVIGVLAVACVGVNCAGGTAPTTEDGGTPQVDAAADAGLPGDDGPVQADAPVVGDGPAATDGPAPTDGAPQQDGTPQQDGSCAVQNTGACDPVCQNCAGQKCGIDATNHQLAACVANGTVGPGGACSGDANGDNCQAGYICLSDGKCRHFCRSDGDCLAANGACIIGITWGVSTPFKACRVPDVCDPVANTGCTSPAGCFVWSSDTQTFCLTAGSAAEGAACPNGNECQGGYVCIAPSGTTDYKCRKICRLTAPVCSGSYTCQTLTGFTTFGFCA